MGKVTVAEAVKCLKEAGIRADRGYPGRLMPHLTGPVVAVNVKHSDSQKQTLVANVCVPMILGAGGCEDAAVKVVAAWSTLGGSCSYGDCRFDGDCELYVLPVLGVWEEEEIII